MNDWLRGVLIVCLCLAVMGCTQSEPEAAPQQDLETDVKAIESLLAQVANAYDTADLGYPDLYVSDPVVMFANMPTMTSKDEIAKLWTSFVDQFDAEMNLSTKEIVVAGNWAFVRNESNLKLTPKSGGESSELRGRNILILQRQPDDTWRLARVIANSEDSQSVQIE